MYNRVFLVGNLTRDPEMRFTTSGLPVTRFTIAVNRITKGEGNDADFLRIVTWRKLAEFCGEYLSKGRSVAIAGRLQIDEYEQDGKKKHSAEVVAEDVQFLGRKGESSGSGDFASGGGSKIEDEDIPF